MVKRCLALAALLSACGSLELEANRLGPSLALGSGHCTAFDTRRLRMVTFGDGDWATGATWEWDGSAWAKVAAGGPPARVDCAMAYDEARGAVVLFGGRAFEAVGASRREALVSGTLSDTWLWDGDTWTELTGPGPDARSGAALVYDPFHRRSILFGGLTACSGPSCRATWYLDAEGWRPLDPR